MTRMILLVLSCCLAVPTTAQEPAGSTVALNGHNFTLPEEFEIELAAGPSLTERPITIDFDEQGRLYVAESSGSVEKIDIQLQKKPHSILRLEDTNGDGRFDKRTVFADHMMFPEGTMWYAGSLYVAAPPSIWKLTDTNDDGVADERIEWFQGKTLTGCANDLHGPYLGSDGWIYWAKGAFAKQTYTRPDGSEWSTRASHIFRCRPDGGVAEARGIEPVMTGGMDNPVDVAFLSSGERVVSNTFIIHPGGGKRDGLIHAVYGGVYGKEHDVVHEHPWTSPQLMPVLSHLGPAAPCGLHCYQSESLGPEYFDNLFTCCFNMRKVVRTVLTPKGASYETKDEDWLVSDHVDFHPTDVLEDADGSLLVVDTGGWYKLCCPTSQIQKPDVLGGIYRIRRKGAKRIADPRGRKIPWDKLSAADLVKLLDDPRPAVQRRAMESLGTRGKEALTALENGWGSESARLRRNLIWTTCRIDHPDARRLASRGVEAAEPNVRQAAGHAASLWRDPAGAALLVRGQAANKRIAAEVAGRCGDREAFDAVLSMFAAIPEVDSDRHLDHSMLYALAEIAGRHPQCLEQLPMRLSKGNARQQRAILTVLDMAKSSHLQVGDVLAGLDSPDGPLRDTAFWIVSRHPEWGREVVDNFRQRLAAKPLPPLDEQMARLAKSAAMQEMLAHSLTDALVSDAGRRIVLRAIQQANPPKVSPAWLESLAKLLPASSGEVRTAALDAALALRRDKLVSAQLNQALMHIALQPDATSKDRLTAMLALPGGMSEVRTEHLEFLMARLSDSESAARPLAAEILGKAKLDKQQLLIVAAQLPKVGPLEIDNVLRAVSQSADDEVGLAVVASLEKSPLKTSLPVGMLRERLKKFSPTVQQQADNLYAQIDTAAAGQKEKLESLLAQLEGGDVRRGQQVFHSAKAACSQCHAIGYAGGTIGPDLTKIGLIRTERDLVESVVFPSSSFVQGYEPNTVVTTEGKIHNGLVRRTTPDVWTVITGTNQSVQLSPADIEEIQLGKVSVMPAGLDQQLTVQQLADLIAYLKACR